MRKGTLIDVILQIRRRRFFVLLSIVVVIIAMAVVVLIGAGVLGRNTSLCNIRIERNGSHIQDYEGIGLNFDRLPSNNLIEDSSFEASSEFTVFTVADGSNDKLFIKPDSINGTVNSNQLIGSTARIYSIDESGRLFLRIQATVTDYSRLQFGTSEEVEDSGWLWTQDPIEKLISTDSSVVAITESGKLISDVTSGELANVYDEFEPVFAGLSKNGQTLTAVTTTGVFYTSADGRNFSEGLTYDFTGLGTITGVASIKNTVFVISDNGKSVVCSDGCTESSEVFFEGSADKAVNTDNRLYVFTKEGKCFSTGNGLVFEEASELEEVIGSDGVRCVSSSSDCVVILTNSGKVVFVTEEGEEITVSEKGQVTINPDFKQYIVVTGDHMTILSDGYGNEYVTGPEDTTLRLLVGKTGEERTVFAGKDNKLFIYMDNSLYQTSLFASITLDQALGEDQTVKGDICYIESEVNTPMENSWETYGDGTTALISDEAASGYGENSLVLSGSDGGVHAVSQVIADNGKDVFIDGSFMRIDIMLRSANITNCNVNVWISGANADGIGFTAEEVGDKFNLYSYTFAVTDSMVKSENEIRLNISFDGVGSVYADGIFLGLDKYSSEGLPEGFKDIIIGASPNIMRFNNLSESSNDSSYFGELETSLRLAKEGNALPWLVFDSYTNADSIEKTLEYLCGSVSSDYGIMRINNGTAVPWNRQFSEIVVEVNDDNNLFNSDLQRSAYVDYIIGAIQQSEYYTDIKDCVVILDGMNYDGGTVLSRADFHAGAFSMNIEQDLASEDFNYISYVNNLYSDFNYQVPRLTGRGNDIGEYISSLSISSYEYNSNDLVPGMRPTEITAARYAVALLTDEAMFTRMPAANVTVSDIGSFYESDMNLDELSEQYPDAAVEMRNFSTLFNTIEALGAIGNSTRLNVTVTDPLDENSEYSSEEFTSEVGVYLFENENGLYLVVANTSDTQQQFTLSGINLSLDGSVVSRYSSSGELLTTRKLGRIVTRQTLQAGEILILEVN